MRKGDAKMPEEERETRAKRHKKSKRSNLIMNLSIGLIVLTVVIILFELLFGGSANDNDPNQLGQNSGSDNSSFVIPPKDESSEDESAESEEESEESSSEEPEESEDEAEINEVPSDDPNVIRAYVGDWEPIGTEQSEPHVTQYDETSVDWAEMKEASSEVTGVSLANMIITWIGNNGEQRVTVTFTDSESGQVYKVYLSWVTEKGWQVTRYEELRAAS